MFVTCYTHSIAGSLHLDFLFCLTYCFRLEDSVCNSQGSPEKNGINKIYTYILRGLFSRVGAHICGG